MPGANPAKRVRLAYVVSHPIQYQADLLREIAFDPEIDLTVFFCSDFSTRTYRDQGFGIELAWDVPLLDGYRSFILPRWFDTDQPSALRPISRGFFRHLLRGTAQGPFDALWVHGYSTVNALHAMLAARALGLPVLIRSDSSPRDRPRGAVKLLTKQAFFSALRPFIDGVLTIGTWNCDYWASSLGQDFPMFFLPYAVDNDLFATRTAAAAARRPELQADLSLDPARPVILFASKLQTRKHCDHLLEAFLQLPRTGSGSRDPYLVIVGDGEERQRLEDRVRESGLDSVRFAGFRNQGELPRFFDLATVFVLPARHEPWGLVVNEAMAAGLAVVVSDQVGCQVDLVREAENGHVYSFGNIAALAAALASILEPDVAERMGRRSREIISRWTYRHDLDGLKRALSAVTRIPLSTPPDQAESPSHLGRR